MRSKEPNEIDFPFLNFNGNCWISNYTLHFIMDAITYLRWELELICVSNRGHWYKHGLQGILHK